MIDHGERRHTIGEPDIPADDAVVPDHRITTQYGSTGIDGHMVFYGRMPLLAGLVLGYIQGAQCHPLVQFYMIPDDRGLSNHDPRTMIDKKGVAYPGRRMNIDTGLAVGMLGKKPRQYFDFLLPELMRQAVNGRGIKNRDRSAVLLRSTGRRDQTAGWH